MAHRSPMGKAVDGRAKAIRLRRMEFAISGLRRSVEDNEIRILECEAQIERYQESIASTGEAIEKKESELAALRKELSDG